MSSSRPCAIHSASGNGLPMYPSHHLISPQATGTQNYWGQSTHLHNSKSTSTPLNFSPHYNNITPHYEDVKYVKCELPSRNSTLRHNQDYRRSGTLLFTINTKHASKNEILSSIKIAIIDIQLHTNNDSKKPTYDNPTRNT
jgi:hypothetical protein